MYRTLGAAAFPLLLLYSLWRGWRDRRYFHRLPERFGFLPPAFRSYLPDAVWIHAVSVGEVLSSLELIRQVRAGLPRARIFLSCGTLAGREAAEAKAAALADGIFYAPFDLVFIVRRVLRTIRPSVVVVLETEIWPNLYRETKRSGAALAVVNGRISNRARPRYGRLRWFFREVLTLPDQVLTQTEQDQLTYEQLGCRSATYNGNLKYDFRLSGDSVVEDLRDWLATPGPLWIAGSTVGPEYEGDVDEDDAVLAAYAKLLPEFPGLRLLVAPRKPERFGVVAAKLASATPSHSRRTELRKTPVLLLDSIGELGSLFSAADVVFMGGTLADRGGHNLLEPAVHARAIVVGPHLENFGEIQRHFREGAGFVEIGSPTELAAAVRRLLSQPQLRDELGSRARALAEAERGATERAVAAIIKARWNATPGYVPYAAPLLRFLSHLWLLGGRLKRSYGLRRQKRLPAPVISVGGIAMGGAGKTPVVRQLVRTLRREGHSTAVLTRGYRRKRGGVAVVRAGASSPVECTGDEAQLIVRDGVAHVGIGADRSQTGAEVARQFRPDVFLLDDGFQHARLHRDLDLVVLDGLDPFAGGGVFPLGRLREGINALKRASAIIITRSEERKFDGVIARIRAAGVDAPILYASTTPAGWVDASSGAPVSTEPRARAVAFCGLGNPAAFWSTLDTLGCDVVERHTFSDHHRYSSDDMKRLAHRAVSNGASELLTTEKDAMNLPMDAAQSVAPLRLLYLRIEVRIEPDDVLRSIIEAAVRGA